MALAGGQAHKNLYGVILGVNTYTCSTFSNCEGVPFLGVHWVMFLFLTTFG